MSARYEVFEAWLEKVRKELEAGQSVRLPIKDLETMGKITVCAIISKDAETLEHPVPLRVVTDLGEKKTELFISIIEEFDELDSVAVET